MELEVRLAAFEGPLELLLHLIDKNKVSIYDIPIAQITEQYMEYVRTMDRTDLDLVSEFLLMAATLLDIKSRMLLPAEKDEDGEEEDPRKELVERLLEYRKYRYLSTELSDLSVGSDRRAFREADIPQEVAAWRPPVDLEDLLADVTTERMKRIFEEIMRRQADRVDQAHSNFGTIRREKIQLADRIISVRKRVRRGGRFSFRSLLGASRSRVEVIVTFMAILELIRLGDIRLTDDSTRDDIIVERQDRPAAEGPEGSPGGQTDEQTAGQPEGLTEVLADGSPEEQTEGQQEKHTEDPAALQPDEQTKEAFA